MKAEIEAADEGARLEQVKASWAPVLNAVREVQQEVVTTYDDTPETRKIWQALESKFVKEIIEPAVNNLEVAGRSDAEFLRDQVAESAETLESVHFQFPVEFHENTGSSPKHAVGIPPWEQEPEKASGIHQLAKAFVASVKAESSLKRADNVRRDLDSFLATLPTNTGLGEALSSATLDTYLRDVKSQDLVSSTKRDKIASVKQFATWAFEREHLESLPRLIQANKFKVEVTKRPVEVYEDAEIAEILGAASGRPRLYILLGLNCGFTQADIADLRHSEVDLSTGVITRKRSKTDNMESVPEVARTLWPETLSLLKANASEDGDRVLLNAQGKPLVEVREAGGEVKRTDAVAKAMSRLRDSMDRAKPIGFKRFRSTAASKLGEHGEYRAYAQHFLGHAPSNVADSHYVRPSQQQFERAMAWLRSKYFAVS
ncbi:tyrosine-type recombinase/integrase [Stieleria magnilauensis]